MYEINLQNMTTMMKMIMMMMMVIIIIIIIIIIMIGVLKIKVDYSASGLRTCSATING
jgi:hypothetical protein